MGCYCSWTLEVRHAELYFRQVTVLLTTSVVAGFVSDVVEALGMFLLD